LGSASRTVNIILANRGIKLNFFPLCTFLAWWFEFWYLGICW